MDTPAPTPAPVSTPPVATPAPPTTPAPLATNIAATTSGVPNLDNVESGLSPFLRKRWWYILLAVFGAVVLSFLNPLYGVFVIVLSLAGARHLYENDLFQAFAASNQYGFEKKGSILGQAGLLFSIGHGRQFGDIVTGNYKTWPLQLFVYTYTIGYGRNSHTYHRAVMSINFNTTLPAFILRRHKVLQIFEEEGESLRSAGYSEKVNLEGNFNDHFQVFIHPNSQVDVLSILTPDVMQLLLGLDQYEVEMTANGSLNIYCKGYITKKEGLINMYKIVESLTPKIGAFAGRQQQLHGSTPVAPVIVAPEEKNPLAAVAGLLTKL